MLVMTLAYLVMQDLPENPRYAVPRDRIENGEDVDHDNCDIRSSISLSTRVAERARQLGVGSQVVHRNDGAS